MTFYFFIFFSFSFFLASIVPSTRSEVVNVNRPGPRGFAPYDGAVPIPLPTRTIPDLIPGHRFEGRGFLASTMGVTHPATTFGAWKVIGRGLVKMVQFMEVVLKGTCISISVEAEETCGGLKAGTCARLEELRKSVDALKTAALEAISRNDELLRWNATNVHSGLEMRMIAEEIDGIITVNAAIMDLLDVMNYDEHVIPVAHGEMTDEASEDLGHYKFRVSMKPSAYLNKVARYLRHAKIADFVKNKLAFGAALGVAMAPQCVPDLLHGMRGLGPDVADKESDMMVLLRSEDTDVTFGYQFGTKKEFFANLTKGAADTVLKEAQTHGMAGFLSLFADEKVKQKTEDLCLQEANLVRVKEGASDEFLHKMELTGTLQRLVDVTKTMNDDDFDRFIKSTEDRNPFDVLKDLEVAEIPSNPHGIGVKVIKKLAEAFKNFEQFFTDIKKSLDLSAQRFENNGVTWNKIGYYGFSALAQITNFANMALCVANIVTTIEGARQMRIKIDAAERETKTALDDIADAMDKAEQLLAAQKSLNKGVLDDLHSMTSFMGKPVDKIPTIDKDFIIRVTKIQNYWALHNQEARRMETVEHVTDVRLYLHSIYGLMQGFYNRILKERRTVQLANYNVELMDIRKNMESSGHKINDYFSILRPLAFSEEFFFTQTFDSFPLHCIRDGSIKSEAGLKTWFGRSKMPMVPQLTKGSIKVMVDFWDEEVDKIIYTLIKTEHWCYSTPTYARTSTLSHAPCTREEVLSVIATDVLPAETNYKGTPLDQYRRSYDC